MERVWLASCLLAVLAGVAPAQSSTDPAERDATAVVEEMHKALGGLEAWQQTRFLRFDWVVEVEGQQRAYVRHLWDRHQGRYRVEWTSREGEEIVALFNVNTHVGRVQVNGEPARDEDEQKYIDQAYARFINDSYWLLMPLKLKDPGVKLEYAGETRLDGQTYDLVHVSFGDVGLTSGDHYWAYINRRTHLMDRWAYFLQDFEGTPARDKATPWKWQKWEPVGPVRLAREKVRVRQNMRIHFPVLQVPASVADEVFESFQAALPGE